VRDDIGFTHIKNNSEVTCRVRWRPEVQQGCKSRTVSDIGGANSRDDLLAR
jgi:hypothetical protein